MGAPKLDQITGYALNPDHTHINGNLQNGSKTAQTSGNLQNGSRPSRTGYVPKFVDECLHHAFEAQARVNPQSPAIDAWDGSLSYGELDVLASTLAQHLVDLGAGPERVVGLMFDKSMWAVVAMLAVMKAGSACVNLAPNQPVRRLETILRKSEAVMIVTSATHEALGQSLHSKIVAVDNDFISGLPQRTSISSFVSSMNPAYILFTSGSTGEPKGIIVEHGSFSSSAAAHGNMWHIGPGTRVFQFAAFTFDVSVADIFTSLSRGACICIPSERDRLQDLALAIRRFKANWAFFTPSVAGTLSPAAVPTLETLVLGGEPATKQLLLDWADRVELIVCYGPAECSVYCSGTSPLRPEQDPLNIGSPIGCIIYIVDPDDHNILVPEGSTGEIVVQGHIVARGYLNQAEDVNVPFLDAAPWSGDVKARLYKTGDLGRINADGTINIEGRKDMQVKIRGQRVELGEIEHHLRKAFLSSSRVLVHTPSRNGSSKSTHDLVAFVVEPDDGPVLEEDNAWRDKVEQVRSSLRNILPSYMIPTLFLPIQSAPLTSNGKIDRARLQEMYGEHLKLLTLTSKDTPAATLTAEESMLSRLWSEVLHIPSRSISPADNFLHMGGDSLKAMLLLGRINEAGFRLSFHAVLDSPDLSTMAKELEPSNDNHSISTPGPFALVHSSDLQAVKSTCAALCQIGPDSVLDVYPATPLQEGLITLSQKEHDQYVSRYVFDVAPVVKADKLYAAWEHAYKCLDILRTRIIYHSGQQKTLQVVVDESVEWNTSQNADDPLALHGETTYGKRLSRLTRLSEGNTGNVRIVWSIHHSLIDAMSVALIFDLVTSRYRDLTSPPLIPFNSFVAHISSLDEHISRDWWSGFLADVSAPNWPALAPGAGEVSTTSHSFSFGLSRNRDFTVATCLRAAWAFLVSTYSNSSDVVFGSTNSGRSLSMFGILAVAGPTIVTVPFRVTFGENKTIRMLLESIQQDSSAMVAHEHVGMQKIKMIDASTRTACDFRSLLVVQPRREESALEGITPLLSAADPVVGSYPLTLECKETAAGVDMVLNYQPDSIPEPKALRLLQQMEQFALRFMAEADQSLVFDGQTTVPESFGYPAPASSQSQEVQATCVQNEFRKMAANQGTSPAVQAWDAEWSYAALDELSTQAAYRLLEDGVRPGSIVPICSTKSGWVIVAMLAVLKAGAAFLPLDPSNPLERLKRIVERVEASVVLSSPESATAFSDIVKVALVSDLCSGPPLEHIHALPVTDASSLAYLIFTSGSTGEPKGVEVEHRAFATGALARAPHIHRDNTSRVFQFSSYGFDTSIEDILTTLITGGCVCVPSEQDRRDDFARAFARLGANTMDITPSLAHVLKPEDLPGLKTLILGGEFMSASLVGKWANEKVTVINTYGPTECAIVASITEPLVVGYNTNTIGRMPCGRPWIVNPNNHDHVLPKGAVGELLIEGPLLARGYYQDPELTQRVFVADVKWAQTGQVFYKTGDLVMLAEDDSLVFLGRKDSQVKIRGQRVELAEVETHVRVASGIENVVVEMVSLTTQEQSLVAFLAVEEGLADTEALQMTPSLHAQFQTCQDKLRAEVPGYMVPSLLIPVSSIPLTRSGKVDKKRLLHIVHSLSQEQILQYRLAEGTHSSPLIEDSHKQLGAIWAAVLGVDLAYLSVDMDFFKAGGDSLSAVRLAASIQDAGFLLSVSDIFRHPKLCEMATHLVPGGAVSAKSFASEPAPFSLLPPDFSVQDCLEKQDVGFGRECVEDMYPTTPTQEALMALSAKQPRAYMARFSDSIHPSVDVSRLRDAWEHVVRSFPILRTRILVDSQVGAVQLVLRPAKGLQSAFRCFPPETMSYGDPLFHVDFGKQGNISLTIHHSMFDAESLETIYREVEMVYTTGATTPQQVSIPRFIASIQARDLEGERAYWRKELDGTPSTAFYTTERTNGGDRREEITTYNIALDDALRSRLSSSKHTTALFLRAAWALTIATFTNADDVLFGVSLSGRTMAYEGLEDLAAPTMTTVPLRIRVDRHKSAHAYLDELTAQSADMIPFEHTGIHRIQQHISRPVDLTNILVVQYAAPSEKSSRATLLPIPVEVADASASYYTEDLVLECTVSTTQVEIRAYWDATKLRKEQLTHQLSSFSHLFMQIVHADATAPLESLQLCDPDAYSQVAQWNMKTSGRPEEHIPASIHELVRKMASEDPGKTAIVAWDGTMSFGELDRHAENLAREITIMSRTENIAGTVVPVLFDKSVYAIVAMIGIMKAGCAYTALDAANPVSRLREMVNKVQARVCLVSPEYRQTLDGTVDELFVIDGDLLQTLDSRRGTSDALSGALIGHHVSPNEKAIIVFTSGSTGSPKPIILSHRAVTSCARGYGPGMRFGRESRVLSNAAYAFDIHACEIFLTLIHGGTLFLTNRDRSSLVDVINEWRINWLFSTPSALEFLPGPDAIPTVKTLMMIGEAPSRRTYSKWVREGLHLINAYGPAENTLFSTMAAVESAHQDPALIGRPCNTAAWVVDPEAPGRMVPVGAVGELVLQGEQLADGYLNEPEKTAAAFIETPKWMGSVAGTKCYKTGDLCQYGWDGTLRILGRTDSQVKLRGQRLETSEVEFHLRKFIDADLVVDCLTFPSGRQALATFVVCDVPRDGSTSSLILKASEEFKAHGQDAATALAEHLPLFMVPTLFIPIIAMPRTASDKLDRKVLRATVVQLSEQEILGFGIQDTESLTPPTTDAERMLQAVWAKVLSIDQHKIGKTSNFEALGGDSITAVRLAVAVRSTSNGKTLAVVDILRFPRLDQMAARLKDESRSVSRPSLAPFALLSATELASVKDTMTKTHSGFPMLDAYPCTPLQEGFMQATSQDNFAYVSHQVFAPGPHVDMEQLRQVWRDVFSKFEILRTIIVTTSSGDMVQVVLPLASESQVVHVPSLSGYFEDADAHAVREGSPLFKVAFVAEPERKVILTAHHAVFDAWFVEKLLAEVSNLYHSRKDRLSDPAPFAHFVHHVRNAQGKDSQLFWQTALEGQTASRVFSVTGGSQNARQECSASRTFKLNTTKTCPYPKTMLPTVVRAAWGLLLSLYADAADVTFGLILNGRSGSDGSTDFDDVAGPTVTTVPFRIAIDRKKSASDYLNLVKNSSVDLLQHQFYDLKRGGEHADVVAATNFDNILDVVVADDTEAETTDAVMVRDQSVKVSQQSSYYLTPMVVLVTLSGESSITLDLTYDSNIIPVEKAAQISAQLELIILQLHSSPPGTPLDNMNLLTEQEHSLIDSWNSHDPDQSASRHCIHDLLAQVILRQPDHSAIEAWDGAMSYHQLDEASSKLAQYLVSLGATSQSRIPLCFDKSLWTPVAMLACLKAGAAYVPLDPSHPTQRLHTIVNFVGGNVMMAGNTQVQRFEGLLRNVVLLDEGLMDRIPESQASFQPRGNPEDTAIVVFTSGSTGLPKGVELSHTSFCTLALEVGEEMDLTKIDGLRVLQFAAYAFDVSNAETFLTLLNGGTLCIITDEEKQNNLGGAISRLAINWLYLTPTATSLLEPDQVPDLKTLILGGEAGSKEIVKKWAHRLHLVNSFGPAEGGIWPSWGHLLPGTSPQNIGRSGGTRLWIVHPENHEQLMGPIGVVGELLLEGPMLASGYLHEPEKTAAVFLAPPRWAASFGAKGVFYKTGDLVSYNADGSLSYVGRKDGLVKLRGQRLDLGDVEHAIKESLQHPMGVAAEVVHFADRQDAVLAAFLCSESLFAGEAPENGPDESKDISEMTTNLQSLLQLRLPPYMVPSAYIPLRAMPLTMSGKRHRKALKTIASEMSVADLGARGASARKQVSTDMESQVARVWATVLGINAEDVYASDNFLELGGNSIHVMRIVALLKAVDINITVAQIFRSQDLSTMAGYCQAVQKSPEPALVQKPMENVTKSIQESYPGLLERLNSQIGITEGDIVNIIPAADFQSHCVYYGSLVSRGTANYLSFSLPTGIDVARIHAAYEKVVAEYPMLRTLFAPYGEEMLQVVVKSSSWTVEIEKLSNVENGALSRDEWIAKDKTKDTTLDKATVRAATILCRDGTAVFVCQQFHARNDAWSDQHFCRDLAAAYEGRELPSRPVFSQVISHRQSLDAGNTETYWSALLEGSEMTHVVAHQCPSYENIVNTTLERIVLDCDASKNGITTATVLKAAWALVLSEYTQTHDVVFGHLTSGRSLGMSDIEEVFGPCLNIVPVRVALGAQQTAVDLLRSVQEQHVASLEHEWMGERAIVRRCTNWSRRTRFSSVVQYQNINEVREVKTRGGSNWDVQLHAIDYDSADMWILAWPEEAEEGVESGKRNKSPSIKVTLCFSENLVSREFGEAILTRLCEVMHTISSQELYPLRPLTPSAQAQLPLPGPLAYDATYLPAHGEPMPSQCMLERLQSVVLKAWMLLLPKEQWLAEQAKTPYYDLTCAPWMATSLAMEFQRLGFRVAVEDVITHPTMEAQTFLLARHIVVDSE